MEQEGDDTLIWIKAVPGASRNEVVGLVGERLKVRVAAAPEAGKANKAICETVAQALGVKVRSVTIEIGATNPEKVIRAARMSADIVREKLR